MELVLIYVLASVVVCCGGVIGVMRMRARSYGPFLGMVLLTLAAAIGCFLIGQYRASGMEGVLGMVLGVALFLMASGMVLGGLIGTALMGHGAYRGMRYRCPNPKWDAGLLSVVIMLCLFISFMTAGDGSAAPALP